jgi:hypothetical protein
MGSLLNMVVAGSLAASGMLCAMPVGRPAPLIHERGGDSHTRRVIPAPVLSWFRAAPGMTEPPQIMNERSGGAR